MCNACGLADKALREQGYREEDGRCTVQTIAEKNVKLKHCRNDYLSIESSIGQKKILQRTHSTRPHPSSEAG